MSKASKLRKINDAYVMLERSCNPLGWLASQDVTPGEFDGSDIALMFQFLALDATVIRDAISTDRTRFYRTGSYAR